MKIIGITGGVGSGKSYVLQLLSDKYNAYIIEADKLAHKLMEPGQKIYLKIVEEFGRDILASDDTIDRAKLGNIVFSDEKKLEKLNMISHPTVKEVILADIEDKKNTGIALFVIEAALLIQDGYKAICDEIWYVHVDNNIRTKRLMDSRGYSEEKCESIYNSQPDFEYFKENSDRLIDNNGDVLELEKQIDNAINSCLI